MAEKDTLVGQTVGKYQIRRRLARGGMATIYVAWHPHLQKEIVLKILRPDYAQDERFVKRFQREASEAARLNHPHIIRIYDAGESGGHHYIAMEYMRRGSLQDLMVARRGQPLNLSWILTITQQVGSALAYAHAHEIIHRDVKPSNILIDEQGMAILTDLGIAKALAGTRLTQTMTTMGTPEYMSPEQGKGADVDARTDIYALGVVLYEMLTGRLPFRGDTPWAVIHQHVYETPPSVHRINPRVPRHVVQAVNKAMVKDPAARFQSVAEMMRALAMPSATPAPKPRPRKAGRAVLWSALAAIAVVILLITVSIGIDRLVAGRQQPTATVLAIIPRTDVASDTPAVAPTPTSTGAVVPATPPLAATAMPTHTPTSTPTATASSTHAPMPTPTPIDTPIAAVIPTDTPAATPTPRGPSVSVSSSGRVNLRDGLLPAATALARLIPVTSSMPSDGFPTTPGCGLLMKSVPDPGSLPIWSPWKAGFRICPF